MKLTVVIPAFGAMRSEGERLAEKFRAFAEVIVADGRDLGDARNRGLAAAHGQWVLFLDADDDFDADWLAHFDFGEAGDVDAVRVGNVEFLDGEQPRYGGEGAAVRVDCREQLDYARCDSWMWQWIYRREKILGLKFDAVGHPASDDALFLHEFLFTRLDGFLDVPRACHGYRVHSGSYTHRYPSAAVWRGELAWRLKAVALARLCPKRVVGLGASWTIHHFPATLFVVGLEGRSAAEADELWRLWFRALKVLSRLEGTPPAYRRRYRLCALFPCRAWARFVCVTWGVKRRERRGELKWGGTKEPRYQYDLAELRELQWREGIA